MRHPTSVLLSAGLSGCVPRSRIGGDGPVCGIRLTSKPTTEEQLSQNQISWITGYIWGICKPQLMRSLEEIRADILALEQETEGLLGEIIGEAAQ